MAAVSSLFSEVPEGPPDPMFVLKKASDEDSSPQKIDLGIGVYRSDQPGYHEFESVAKAKSILQHQPADHEYNPTTGIQSFVDAATNLVFGPESTIVKERQVASVQTVGGTGAVRLGAAFLNRNYPTHSRSFRATNPTKIYIGIPAWPNYMPLFQHAGFNVQTFRHYDPAVKSIDMDSALKAISTAPNQSIFILQVCCHNPTGQDYTKDQWRQLATAIQVKSHFIFFDMAYQGFAQDIEADAWPVRYFASLKIDMLVCQSISKQMGLYAERVGALHVVCNTSAIAANVKDQLRSLIRWEVSSTPAYGAKLAQIIMQDVQLDKLWRAEVQEACDRMTRMRRELHHLLVDKYQIAAAAETKTSTTATVPTTIDDGNTPATLNAILSSSSFSSKSPPLPSYWEHILHEKGLFSYMQLSPPQIRQLREKDHIYIAESGRVNIAGLSDGNIERFARALKAVFAHVDDDKDDNRQTSAVTTVVTDDTEVQKAEILQQSRL